MKRVLIIPQLHSHLLSAQIIEKKLAENKSEVSFINTSNIYGFNLTKGLEILNPNWFKKKLYEYSGIQRNILEVFVWFRNKNTIIRSRNLEKF